MRPPKPIEAYYIIKHYVGVDTPCWIWTGGTDQNGYAKVWKDGKMWMAYKYLYEQKMGRKVLYSLKLDHICENKSCVNPDHLREVSHRENCLATKERELERRKKMGLDS